jgi:hypothetical protein
MLITDDGWLHICRLVLAAENPVGTDRSCSRKPDPSCAITTKTDAFCQLNKIIDAKMRISQYSGKAQQERASNRVCMCAPLQKGTARN